MEGGEERIIASVIGTPTQSNDGGSRSEPAQEATRINMAPPDSDKKGRNSSPNSTSESSERVDAFLQSVQNFDGSVLKKVRNLRGITLEELSDQTKIRKTYLQYLEEEEFRFLPAPVYIKGFVIILANALGIPSQKVAEDYMVHYQAKSDPKEV